MCEEGEGEGTKKGETEGGSERGDSDADPTSEANAPGEEIAAGKDAGEEAKSATG